MIRGLLSSSQASHILLQQYDHGILGQSGMQQTYWRTSMAMTWHESGHTVNVKLLHLEECSSTLIQVQQQAQMPSGCIHMAAEM